MNGQGMTFETFEHVADVGVRGKGRTLSDAFVGGALAMIEVMFDISQVERRASVDIECSGFDMESLFVEWLNAILTKRDLEEMVFSEFTVDIDDTDPDGPELKGKAWGEAYDPDRHDAMTEVKAATYSQLKVYKEGDLFVVQCIVDV